MHVLSRLLHIAGLSRRKNGYAPLLVLLCAALLAPYLAGASPFGLQPGQPPVAYAGATPLRPYVYAVISAPNYYDLLLADGVNKDRRVSRVKVDSVFFSDVTARLSNDGSTALFRVSGNRAGGSSLYVVNIQTGKYNLIASTRTAAEGIGAFAWSPAGNTLAYVRAAPALDPAAVDSAYGSIYIYSVGFQAMKLAGSSGNDRLLGFSTDGLGVYVDRQQTSGDATLEDLVYLPLSGAAGSVLIRSQPGLRFSNFTLWSAPNRPPKVAYLAEGDFSLVTENPNIKDIAALIRPIIMGTARVPTVGQMAGPDGFGLIVSDPLGILPVLLRRDAEDYPFMAWTLDGGSLLLGGVRQGADRTVNMQGAQQPVDTSLSDLTLTTWSTDGSLAVLSDTPTSRIVTLNPLSGNMVATRYVGYTPKAGPAAVRLAVPYIQQVRDIAAKGNGNWACGPTSIAMALAYYGKLEPWSNVLARSNIGASSTVPATPVTPRPVTGADFAPYITEPYTYNGHTYNATAKDPQGNLLAGLYGTIAPTGFASWPMMESVLQWHGLSSQFVSVTWDGIVAALRRGHPVLLGNMLTTQGHILLVIGYTTDGNLIVNDPYGNRFAAGYGSNDGNGVLYPWKRTTARRALEIIGVYPPPTPTPVPIPTSTATPTFTSTPIATPTDAATPTALSMP